jgi:hypothetical protein
MDGEAGGFGEVKVSSPPPEEALEKKPVADLAKDQRIAELEKICEKLSTKLKASKKEKSAEDDVKPDQAMLNIMLNEKDAFLQKLITQKEMEQHSLNLEIKKYQDMRLDIKKQLENGDSSAISSAIAAATRSHFPTMNIQAHQMSTPPPPSSGYGTSSFTSQSATTPVAPPAPQGDKQFLERREQLIRFYDRHHHKKMEKSADMLAAYKFEDVCSSLKKTYGDLPRGWSDLQACAAVPLAAKQLQLQEYYEVQHTKRLGAVDTILSHYTFKDVVRSVKKKYGEVPPGWEKELTWSFSPW